MAPAAEIDKSLPCQRGADPVCPDCRLPASYCVCIFRRQHRTRPGFCLLYHSSEPQRTSNTGRLVEECIDPSHRFLWSRSVPPAGLLALLASPDWMPLLVFPGEYAAKGQQVIREVDSHAEPRPLLLLIDATWSQARKMLRQSPYLQQLPCLDLDPQEPSRYRLRRSRRADHLCTAEVAELCLQQLGEGAAAQDLGRYFDRYCSAWLAARDNLPNPSTDQ